MKPTMTSNEQFAAASNLLMDATCLRAEALNPDNDHCSVELMRQSILKEEQAQALLKLAFGVTIPLDHNDEV